MNRNSEIIFMLCSHLLTDPEYKPYEPSEWSKLAQSLMNAGLQPYDLTEMSDSDLRQLNLENEEIYRLKRLFERGSSLVFEMEKYESMGISVVTRADVMYPKMLKSKLGKSCPPLFYYSGNLKLAEYDCVGFVGSRNVDDNDIRFTEKVTSTINSLGYAVVSGGAKGVDTVSIESSMKNGSQAVIYLADSMVKKIRSKQTITAIQKGQLLLLSVVKPNMSFTTATAMMRNRYIYAQSKGTVVTRSDYKKGGTWSGAVDCIKHKISPIFCWNNIAYKGNQELIKFGAMPIDESWNGDMSIYNIQDEKKPIQLT
ncbi:MAG: DNA-processing protein DprA, partial [Oscillospiraceae bacterium]|nr:DNA-processing protein DprA [Oscillospiraceae bacterium]